MLIDCDTCTARGAGCADCVVTVLLGAPPGWRSTDPVVVPLPGRSAVAAPQDGEEEPVPLPGVVVDFDDVERRAVSVLARSGLVPPLRHEPGGPGEGRHASGPGRRTG